LRLLLDTQVAIWWFAASRRLGTNARRAIVEAETVFVSAISCAEASIKVSLGKLKLPGPLSEGIAASGFVPLALTVEHAEALSSLPHHHRDPFDRLLIAQANVEELALVTGDHAFDRYDVRLIAARA
jgi:PIN domain nuclease of toxin-antitoxin system